MSIEQTAPPQPAARPVAAADLKVVATLIEHNNLEVAALAAELIVTRDLVTDSREQVRSGKVPVTPGTARCLTVVCVQLEESLAKFRATLRELA